MIEWRIYFKMIFWPNYISCCTDCITIILNKNPYPDYPILQVEHLLGSHALEGRKCSHIFGGVKIGTD